ncbi:HNH endonuclease [Planctomycetota bacterium]
MAKLPNMNVLVLNKYFAGIHVCSLLRAVSLTFDEKAEVITVLDSGYYPFSFREWVEVSNLPEMVGLDSDKEILIRTGKADFFAPRIIRLTASAYTPNGKKQLRPTRSNVLIRDDYTCQYCGHKYSSSRLNLDHIKPKSKGGKSTWLNLVTSCKACNTNKADRTLKQSNMKLIRLPFKPQPIEFLTKKLDPAFLHEYKSILGVV